MLASTILSRPSRGKAGNQSSLILIVGVLIMFYGLFIARDPILDLGSISSDFTNFLVLFASVAGTIIVLQGMIDRAKKSPEKSIEEIKGDLKHLNGSVVNLMSNEIPAMKIEIASLKHSRE